MSVKYLDENGLLYFWTKLKDLFNGKVDKVEGKGLSTNDYTLTEKNKLAGIATGATANSPSSSNPLMNGTASAGSATDYARGDHVHPSDTTRAPLNSPALTGEPTAPTPTSGNDSTRIATTAFVVDAIADAVGDISGMSFEIVESLPASGDAGTIYLLDNAGSGQNVYDEYIWINSAWEKIGTTAVDLSGYVQDSDLIAITNAEVDTIMAS